MNKFLQYRKELICHELGHWLVAKILGFKVGDIELEILGNQNNYGHNGSSKIYLQPHIQKNEELDKYLVDRICVLYAGVSSQSIINENRMSIDELLASWGQSDNAKIQELIFILRAIRFTKKQITIKNEIEHKQNITDECWNKAKHILNNNKKSIKQISSKIEMIVKVPNTKYIVKYRDLLSWLEN